MLYERWDVNLPNDENKENMIVNRIKEYIKNEDPYMLLKKGLMLRNGQILSLRDYHKHHYINVKDYHNQHYINVNAYVYINTYWDLRAVFHYPFLIREEDLLNAFLSKLGFHYEDFITPAINLKYIVDAVGYGYYPRYLSIEVINLDTVANNLNLPKMVIETLGEKMASGKKELTEKEYEKIRDTFKFQKLFANSNYDFNDVFWIIGGYYDSNKISLADKVDRIVMDYVKLYKPYKVCYNMESWDEVDCSLLD